MEPIGGSDVFSPRSNALRGSSLYNVKARAGDFFAWPLHRLPSSKPGSGHVDESAGGRGCNSDSLQKEQKTYFKPTATIQATAKNYIVEDSRKKRGSDKGEYKYNGSINI